MKAQNQFVYVVGVMSSTTLNGVDAVSVLVKITVKNEKVNKKSIGSIGTNTFLIGKLLLGFLII